MLRQKLLIRIETVGNPNMRNYHTKTQISEAFVVAFDFPLEEDISTKLKKLGPKGSKILSSLSKISGIEKVWIKRHLISVVKQKDLDWKEIEPKILEAMIQ